MPRSADSVNLPGQSANLNPSSRIKGIVAQTLKTKGISNPLLAELEDETPAQPAAPDKVAAPDKPVQRPGDTPQDEDKAPVVDEAGKPAEVKPGEVQKDGKKESPWKLVETYKKRAAVLEKELAETRSKIPVGTDVDGLNKKLEETTSRLKAADEELRFVNYSKSAEFKEKFGKPYEEAWQTAVSELAQIPLTLRDGSTRNFTDRDLITFANMDPATLTTTLKEVAPDFSDDIKAHVREVRKLAMAQTKALDDAKKMGSERFEQQMGAVKQANDHATKLWTSQLDAASKRALLQPVEGDDEWNTAVNSSTEFVDGAFKGNAFDPRLKPEDREKLIKDKVKLRVRALEAPLLKMKVTRLETQLAAVQKELDELKGSGPSGGHGGKKDGDAAAPGGDPMTQAKQLIRTRARPGA